MKKMQAAIICALIIIVALIYVFISHRNVDLITTLAGTKWHIYNEISYDENDIPTIAKDGLSLEFRNDQIIFCVDKISGCDNINFNKQKDNVLVDIAYNNFTISGELNYDAKNNILSIVETKNKEINYYYFIKEGE